MSEPPILVLAEKRQHAEYFLAGDLHIDPKRLMHVRSPDALRGMRRGQVLFILPGAENIREFADIIWVAEDLGMIFACINDQHDRKQHALQQRAAGPFIPLQTYQAQVQQHQQSIQRQVAAEQKKHLEQQILQQRTMARKNYVKPF